MQLASILEGFSASWILSTLGGLLARLGGLLGPLGGILAHLGAVLAYLGGVLGRLGGLLGPLNPSHALVRATVADTQRPLLRIPEGFIRIISYVYPLYILRKGRLGRIRE